MRRDASSAARIKYRIPERLIFKEGSNDPSLLLLAAPYSANLLQDKNLQIFFGR